MSFANEGLRPHDAGDEESPLQQFDELELTADESAELEEIMDRLRAIADVVDAPPPIVTELAKAAFETRNLDDELALLTADSDVDVLELVRSVVAEPRMVSFETATVSVELQLDHLEGSVTVRGLVVGAVGQIVLDTGNQRIGATIDERGWFVVDGVPTGALRLRLVGVDGVNVTTEWITT